MPNTYLITIIRRRKSDKEKLVIIELISFPTNNLNKYNISIIEFSTSYCLKECYISTIHLKNKLYVFKTKLIKILVKQNHDFVAVLF